MAIKKGQSRETGNIDYTRRRKTKQNRKMNDIFIGTKHIVSVGIIQGKDYIYYWLASSLKIF